MPGTNGTNDYEIPGAKLKTSVPSDKYKEGWDRIFGSKPNDKQFNKKKDKGRSKSWHYHIKKYAKN